MAVIVPDRFVYLHIPKTGGKWVKAILRKHYPNARLVRESTHGNRWARHAHADLEDVRHHDLFKFAFVRHPVDWWRSFYRHRARSGWVDGHEIDDLCRADDFDTYVQNVLDRLPGFASKMFAWFVGDPRNEIDFIGRQENLAEDLAEALSLAGCDTRPLNLNSPRVNEGEARTANIQFTPKQWAALAEAEREGIDRFGYCS